MPSDSRSVPVAPGLVEKAFGVVWVVLVLRVAVVDMVMRVAADVNLM